MAAGFLAQLSPIGEVTTLVWVHDDVAQSYMEHIVQRAQHLLPRHGWRVATLKEFYPRGARLLGLNVNKGSEVCVRLRVPGSKSEFLPFHEVLCTALHEFAHCQISAHDKAFSNVYYGLVRECEVLETQMIARGDPLYPKQINITPSGFSSPRHGGGTSRTKATAKGAKPSVRTPVAARQSSGKQHAAESRPADTVLGGEWGPGRRLGGDSGGGGTRRRVDTSLTGDALRRILADAVLARRTQYGDGRHHRESNETEEDSGACGPSGVGSLPDEPPTSQVVKGQSSWLCDRCGYCNAREHAVCQACSNEEERERGRSPSPLPASAVAVPNSVKRQRSSSDRHLSWQCSRCTFINMGPQEGDEGTACQCEMCGAARQAATVQGASAPEVIEISDSEDDDVV